TAAEFVEDQDGSFWMDDGGSLIHWDPKIHRALPGGIKDVATTSSGIQRVIPDGEGGVLVAGGGASAGLVRARKGHLEPYKAGDFDGSQTLPTSIFRDSTGALWIGTSTDRIYRVTGTQVDHYGPGDGLSSPTAAGFFEDREGNIWVLTKEGVDRFRDMVVTTTSAREGLRSNSVQAVTAASDGSVWINIASSLDALHPDGSVTALHAHRGLPGQRVGTVTEDRNKRLWVGIDDDLYI